MGTLFIAQEGSASKSAQGQGIANVAEQAGRTRDVTAARKKKRPPDHSGGRLLRHFINT
jgi:hypothetical protein